MRLLGNCKFDNSIYSDYGIMRYNIRITTMHACSSGTLTVQSTASLKYLTAGTRHDLQPRHSIQTQG